MKVVPLILVVLLFLLGVIVIGYSPLSAFAIFGLMLSIGANLKRG